MTSRTCKKCNLEKSLDEFPIYNKVKGYRRHECGVCNKRRVAEHHETNKDRRLKRARERYHLDPSAHWTPERRHRANEMARIRYEKLRNKVFDRYGSECAACGETERMFLTIDHINNDGWKLRMSGASRESGSGLYKDVLKNGLRSDLEILCYNCNFGKQRNGGILVKDRRVK